MRRIEIRKRGGGGGGGGGRREDPSKGGKRRREGERGFFNLFCLCYELGERVRRGGGGWCVSRVGMHRVGSAGNNANASRPRKERRLTYVLRDSNDSKVLVSKIFFAVVAAASL